MTAIAYRESSALSIAMHAAQLMEVSSALVKSGLIPGVRTPEAAFALIVKGQELGLPPMAALAGITVINGKPTVSPQLMLSLIDRSGLCEDRTVETGPQGAVVTMKRRGRSPHTARFGPNEAKAMGLDKKDNYQKQPGVMYQWRAVAACARVVSPDVIDGLYTPEEMGADVQVDEDGAMTVQATPAQDAREAPPVVQQEAKAPPADAGHEKALQAWASKIGDKAAKIKARFPSAARQVEDILEARDWRSNVESARHTSSALTELMHDLVLPEESRTDSDVVDAELREDVTGAPEGLLTAAQRGSLHSAAKGMGMATSAERAALWGYFLNSGPVPTVNLLEAQAAFILGELTHKDMDERRQCADAARAAAKGKLLNAPPAPFDPRQGA